MDERNTHMRLGLLLDFIHQLWIMASWTEGCTNNVKGMNHSFGWNESTKHANSPQAVHEPWYGTGWTNPFPPQCFIFQVVAALAGFLSQHIQEVLRRWKVWNNGLTTGSIQMIKPKLRIQYLKHLILTMGSGRPKWRLRPKTKSPIGNLSGTVVAGSNKVVFTAMGTMRSFPASTPAFRSFCTASRSG